MVRNMYFFAEQQIDFALCASLNSIIKQIEPQINTKLFYVQDPGKPIYDNNSFFLLFDQVQKLRYVSYWKYGMWKKGFTIRNIVNAIRRNFPPAIKASNELKGIKFSSNSIAFVFNGISLNYALFLRRIKRDSKVKSILFTTPEFFVMRESKKDFFLHYSRSRYLHFHHYFFGTAPADIYWLKTSENIRTNGRELHFRKNPADYVFNTVFPYQFKSLRKDQIFLPLIMFKKRRIDSQRKTVVFIGQPHYWMGAYPRNIQKIFYSKLNEIILLVKKKYPSHRLIYKRHPGENDQNFKQLNTSDFEKELSISSENLFLSDLSIVAVYSFCSTSVQTAACFGIQSFYLYDLFDSLEIGVPEAFKRLRSKKWSSEIYPKMNIKSIDDWMNGKNDYTPMDRSEEILKTTKKMLSVVGFD